MAEVGCLRDGHFQNLEVSGSIDFGATDDLTLQSSIAQKPIFTLKCTDSATSTASELRFVKDETDVTNATGEVLGTIAFYGDDGETVAAQIVYANVIATASDISSGAELGKMSFEVACAAGVAAECLSITGSTTAAASTVAVLGNITVAGSITGLFPTETVSAGVDPAPAAAESGKYFLIAASLAATTITLPAVAAGLHYHILFVGSPGDTITLDTAGTTIISYWAIGIGDDASPEYGTGKNTITLTIEKYIL